MLLAVDIGNSRTKIGVFDEDKLISKTSIPTSRELTSAALGKILADKITEPIAAAIVSSVVLEVDDAFREYIFTQHRVAPILVSHELNIGLKINYRPPEDVGADRLVNAFAAADKYGVPCIVCSFGTATTIDVVNEKRELLGGLIAPGMNTMIKALNLCTSKLPEVKIKKPDDIIANSTVASIQSGVVNGHIAMIERLIKLIIGEIGVRPRVVTTGGFAELIASNTDAVDIVDDDLTLEGLRRLYERNS